MEKKYFKAPTLWKKEYEKDGNKLEYCVPSEGLNLEQFNRFTNALKPGCGFKLNAIRSKADGSTIGYYLDIITQEAMNEMIAKANERKARAKAKSSVKKPLEDLNF